MAIRRLKKKVNVLTNSKETSIWLQKIVADPKSENISKNDLIKLSRYFGKIYLFDYQLFILLNLDDKYLNNSDRVSRVYALLMLDHEDLALEYFSKLPYQDQYKYHLVSALIEKVKGNISEAKLQLELIQYKYKDKYETYYFLAQICEKFYNYDQALSYYKESLPMVKDNSFVKEGIKNNILELLLLMKETDFTQYVPFFTKFKQRQLAVSHEVYIKVQYHFNHIHEFCKTAKQMMKVMPDDLHANVYKVISYHLINKYHLRDKYFDKIVKVFSYTDKDYNLILLMAKEFCAYDDHLFLKAMDHYEIISDMDKKEAVMEYIIDSSIILSKYNDALNFLNRLKSELVDETDLAKHFCLLYLYLEDIDQTLYYLNLVFQNTHESRLETEMEQILLKHNFMVLLDSHLSEHSDILSKYPELHKFLEELRNKSNV